MPHGHMMDMVILPIFVDQVHIISMFHGTMLEQIVICHYGIYLVNVPPNKNILLKIYSMILVIE